MIIRKIVLGTILMFVLFLFANAQIFKNMTYQGVLTDSSGNRISGTKNLTFKIYNAETGGSQLWSEDTTYTFIDSGIVNITLGSITPLNLDGTQQYWLEITVEGNVLLPRIKLTAVPYSMNADRLDGQDASTFASAVHNHDANYVNDGSGEINNANDFNFNVSTFISNLDADLLDGQHASSFLSTTNDYGRPNVTIDLYEGSSTLTRKYVNENDTISIRRSFPEWLVYLENSGGTGGTGIEAKAGIGGKFWGVVGVDAYVPSNFGGGYAVMGTALNTTGTGVRGSSKGRDGIVGITEASNYAGVRGEVKNMSVPAAAGVSGGNDNASGYGVAGWSSAGKGIYGWSSTGYAGYFDGNVHVNGTLTASNKQFAHSHPNDSNKEIIYVSLEGGEAGTYIRGCGQLEKGIAIVSLPEHFGLVTSIKGLTAQVTPKDETAVSYLYVESVTPEQLIVKEAHNGTSDTRFDYLIQGVRIGYENHQVIQERIAVKPERVGTEKLNGLR